MITETTIAVRYPDCDCMGIVHHAVYPIWYEIARMDFFEKMGFSYSDMHQLGINPPMVELDLKYQSPVSYPGQVSIRTHLSAFAPKKLELLYETWSGAQFCGSARSFHIWTGPDMKSLNMKEHYPEVYAKIVAAME